VRRRRAPRASGGEAVLDALDKKLKIKR